MFVISAGVVSTVVPDSPHKLFIGGLPNYLNDDQVLTENALNRRSCFHLLRFLLHLKCAKTMFYLFLRGEKSETVLWKRENRNRT